jgi:hypothetical protein
VDAVVEQVIAGVRQALIDMQTYTQDHPDFEMTMTHLAAVFAGGIDFP